METSSLSSLRKAATGWSSALSALPFTLRTTVARRGKEKRTSRRVVTPAVRLLAGLAFVAFLAGGFFAVRLAQGPIRIDALAPLIADSLNERFGHRYEFSVGATAIVKSTHVPTFGIDGFEVRDKSGRTILTAPRAEVSIDLFALFVGEVRPRRLEVSDLELDLALLPGGALALPTAPDTDAAAEPPSGVEAPAMDGPPVAVDSGSAGLVESLVPANADQQQSALIEQATRTLRAWIDMLTSASSPIAAIDRIGITRGRLVVTDRTSGRTLNFQGVQATFDKTARATTFHLSVDGPNGRWSATGLARGAPGGEPSLTLSLENLSEDEILIATGARSIGADFSMPLSADVTVGLHPDGRLAKAAGQVHFGSGFLRFDDPEDEPMLVDKAEGGFHFDTASGKIVIDPSRLVAGDTLVAFEGSVTPPARDGDPWSIALVNAEPNIAAPERPGQTKVVVTHGELAARLSMADKKFVIDRFSFNGPECGFAMAGEVDWTNGPRVRLGASMNPTPARVVLRLWPSFIVAPVRAWLLGHMKDGIVESGTLRVDFDAPTLERMRAERAPPDDSVLLDFSVRDASVDFLPGVPALRGFSGFGHITGRTSSFTATNGAIEAARGQILSVPEGTFHVADADLKPLPATVTAKVSASVTTIENLLARDALKPFSRLPMDASALKGEVDGVLVLSLKLDPAARPEDAGLEIHAKVADFSADGLIGREGLESAVLNLDIDPAGLRAVGDGHMFGTQAHVDVIQPTGKPAKASINMTLGDATRASRGICDFHWLSGPIGVAIAAPLGTDKPRADVEVDLTRAAIEAPGLSKPAGRPGRVTFAAVLKEGGTLLDQVLFDAGAMEARGTIELGPEGSLLLARFPVVKLAPGDDMKVDAVKAGDALKVVVRGSSIDARPFLKALVFTPPDQPRNAVPGAAASDNSGTGQGSAAAVKEIDFDVRSNALAGYNNAILSGADLRLVKRGEEIRQFSVSGQFGRAPLSGNLVGGPTWPQLVMTTEDAGSLLSFLDLYKHMNGGQLSVAMRVSPQALDGVLVIDNFVLRDEPAMRRLVSESVPPPDDNKGRRPRIDANAVAFNKLRVRFLRDGTRLDLRDGTMHGEAIGLTVDGWLDYAHDRVDMSGTFVPAFAVNNLFSKIPVFGAILGGGTDEGLIGVNFRIEGKSSAPTLSINPLSAIAPGILRQIFGVGDSTFPTGAVQ